jgi:hypothetical protein
VKVGDLVRLQWAGRWGKHLYMITHERPFKSKYQNEALHDYGITQTTGDGIGRIWFVYKDEIALLETLNESR